MPLTLPNTLTAGTPENVTHVQQNFAEIANAFPVTTANITDLNVTTAKLASGAVTPRKASTIYHAVAASGAGFVPFTGLNGDADYAYEITGNIYTTTSVTPTDDLQIRPNSGTTNYVQRVRHYTHYGAGAPTHSAQGLTSTTGLSIPTYTTATLRMQFSGILQAKTGTGRRLWRVDATLDDGGVSAPYMETSSQYWSDTTTNITSLQFVWAGVGAVINGWISLRKLAEA